MHSIQATKDYIFDNNYLRALLACNSTSLCFLYDGPLLMAACILFDDGNSIVEYHLGCESKVKGSTHSMLYMLYLVASTFKMRGYKLFYLGGGRSTNPDDSLLNFKLGLGSSNSKFYIASNIYMPDTYAYIKGLNPSYSASSRILFYRDGI